MSPPEISTNDRREWLRIFYSTFMMAPKRFLSSSLIVRNWPLDSRNVSNSEASVSNSFNANPPTHKTQSHALLAHQPGGRAWCGDRGVGTCRGIAHR